MPSKITGPSRASRFRERMKANGYVQLNTWVPSDQIEAVRVLIKRLDDEHFNRTFNPQPDGELFVRRAGNRR